MRLLVNGTDLTSALVEPPARGWRYPTAPGAVTYTTLAALSLRLRLADTGLAKSGYSVEYTEDDGYSRRGVVTTQRRAGAGQVDIDIIDRVQARLDAQIVAGTWIGSPAGVLADVLLAYGIDGDTPGARVVRARQARDGMVIRYAVAVGDGKTLSAVVGELTTAGYFRALIRDGSAWMIGRSVPGTGLPAVTLTAADVRGFPKQDPPVRPQYEGGRVGWIGGEVVDLGNLDGLLPLFAADYSAPPLEFLGPDGARALIDLATAPVPRAWKVPVSWRLANTFLPGERCRVLAGILADQDVACRVVGVERASIALADVYLEEGV